MKEVEEKLQGMQLEVARSIQSIKDKEEELTVHQVQISGMHKKQVELEQQLE